MRTNVIVPSTPIHTAEGGRAVHINAQQQLTRLVNSCFLWEDGFYVDGKTVGDLIVEAAHKCSLAFVANTAVEARHTHHLRHVPLLLLAAMATHPSRNKSGGSSALQTTTTSVIDRADELGECLAVYAKVLGINGRKPGNGFKRRVPSAMKRGIAKAFDKFSEYQFSKYNRDGAFTLRDVARIVHPAGLTPERGDLYRRLFKGEKLAAANTWEEQLSAGGDKRQVFTDLLTTNKLGYLALLRNLRGMLDAGVDESLIKQAIVARKGGADKVLPFRYTAAARHAPRVEKELDIALRAAIGELPKFAGRTIVLVDTSGSMGGTLSAKSDLTRRDAAATLASVIDGDIRVFWFTDSIGELPHRLGMAGIDQIARAPSGGTYLGAAVGKVNELAHDRLIVITDEQSADRVPAPKARHAYMINVAANKNGVGYRQGWTHIDGFSEGVLRFIHAHERE